jgi:hypothetical protein
MTVIISKDNFKIIQIEPTIFRIEFATPCPALIHSLVKIKQITGATASDDYKNLKFKAQTVKMLRDYTNKPLSIHNGAVLIARLSRQLQYLLEHENHTIIGYNPENIIVINDQIPAFLGSECVIQLVDGRLLLSYPFSHSDFFVSPELLQITELPSFVHYKTAYFSLACLVIFALMGNDDFYYKYLQKEICIIDVLNNHPIKNTKLYWLLSRCLYEEPEKRVILFI